MSSNDFVISIIGLGRLGTGLLASVASRGFRVIGVDVNTDQIQAVNTYKPLSHEPGLVKLLKKNKSRLFATKDYHRAIQTTNITFVVVPTPSKKDGSFSTKYVKDVIGHIGSELKKKKSYHVVAIISTLSPQSMTKEILPELQKASGKMVGKEIGLCYNPSFIALGNIIDNFLSPDFVLIGELDKKVGDVLETFYKKLCINNPPIKRMNFINAEIAKIALNTFITTKISYANMLAQLCEQTPGADARMVTGALEKDTRIGKKYLSGAVAYGGPCFPRDNRALRAFGKSVGVSLPIAQATDRINQAQTMALIKLVQKLLTKKSLITILGLSYKPDTDVVEKSQGLNLALRLSQIGHKVMVYDPVSMVHAEKSLGNTVQYANTLHDAILNADGLIITTAWPQFKKLPSVLTKRVIASIIIFDCWSIINPHNLPSGALYISRGMYADSIKTITV